MDYARIYDEFIVDRTAKPIPDGYTEIHHILPRSLGGSDDRANLIRLTPEDHFFAHLLLAKVHGGTQWISVVRMGHSRVHGRQRWALRRFMYGSAKRQSAVILSGKFSGQHGMRGLDNGMYDITLHEWTNLDTGETASATKGEMWEIVGGCRSHWTSVVTGKRKSMMGWTTQLDSIRVRSSKGKLFHFANDNGDSFVGTQTEFAAKFRMSGASASRIARRLTTSQAGWRVKVDDATGESSH